MTPAELTNDVLRKAAKLDVRVEFDVPPFEAYYMPTSRSLHTQPIRDYGIVFAPDSTFSVHETPEVAYFVALHELGHTATLPSRFNRPATPADEVETLHYEAAAWTWALDNSVIPITAEMREMARAALKHYRDTSRDLYVQAYPPDLWQQTVTKLNDLAVAA